MNKTLRHYRRLAFHWHSWPVQFCNSIKIKSQNPLVSQHCFHMPKPCVRITASNLPPKQCLYCFITVQWVEFKITCSCLLLWPGCAARGLSPAHQAWNHSLTGWPERQAHFSVWKNILSARSKPGDISVSVSSWEDCASPRNATSRGSMVSMGLPHRKQRSTAKCTKLRKGDTEIWNERHLRTFLYVF